MEFLLVVALIGLIPAAIASSKGRSLLVWWAYGAIIFIVALPHALMLSYVVCKSCGRKADPALSKCSHCKSELAAGTAQAQPAQPGVVTKENWDRCQGCGTGMFLTAKACTQCGQLRDGMSGATKSCPFCAEKIQLAAKKCRFCGEFLHETPALK